jgi:hypothetical protein
MRPPANWDVFGPLHSLYERFDCWREQKLVVRYGNQAELGVKACILLHLEQQLAAAHERAQVGEGIRGPVSVTQPVYDGAQLRQRNVVRPAVLAQQPGLYEFSPRNGTCACGLDSDHRAVLTVAVGATVKPPMQR